LFLKRIDINGFKSFPNRTELIIEKGITGIVGPNGSGKSNIADAIRWVLGEQSSKNLRGVKMEDVIFSGTVNRPRKAYCEVSLVFDNEQGRVLPEYSEVSVSRKMYRSGESEYFINKSQVRLKDVLDLIRDTGIGKEGYSIIGQGRIDEILASKPTERRKVFEEAAGIMKYRVRKEEAERKLTRTEDNLTRVEDILEELRGQLEPLKEQMEKTKAYLSLRDHLKTIDVNLYLYNYEKLNSRIENLSQSLMDIETQIIENERQYVEYSELIESKNAELEQLTELTDNLKNEQMQVSAEFERSVGEHKLLLERKQGIEDDLNRIRNEIESSDQSLMAYSKEIEGLQQRKNEFSGQQKELEETLVFLQKQYDDLKRQSSERANQVDDLKQRRLESFNRLSECKSGISAKEAEANAILDTLKELEKTLSTNESERNLLIEQKIRLEEDLVRAESSNKELVSQINQLNSEIGTIRSALEESETEIARMKASNNDFATTYKLLLDLKKEYEGYSDSVKNLFRAAEVDSFVQNKIIGTLAELIKVPTRYETAIEMALGGALQNIVVPDDDAAKQIVDFLHKNKLGRITFLPVKNLKVSYLTETEKRSLKHRGFIAVASEAVEFDGDIAPAVEFLLARTVIVSDMDSAIEIMKDADYSFRAVTLQGDIVRPGGVITGGSVQPRQFSLLSRNRKLDELKADIQAIEVKIGEAETGHQELLFKMDERKKAVADLMGTLRNLEITLAQSRQKHSGIMNTLETATAVNADLKVKSEAASAQQQNCRNDIKTLEAQLNQFNEMIAELDEEYSRWEYGSEQSAEELLRMMNEINAYQVKRAETAKELESIETQSKRLQMELNKFAESSNSKKDQISLLNSQRLVLEKQIEEILEFIEDKKLSIEDSNRDFQFHLKKVAQMKEAIMTEQKHAVNLKSERDTLVEKKYKSESQIEKLRLTLENAQEKIWQDYELTYINALPYKQSINYSESARQADEYREQMRAMGPVNPAAIQDYERVLERVQELETQQNDLNAAKTDLYKIISGLMDKMKESFQVKFEQINENFKDIFAELFGGGDANLKLGDGDIMECGIEIEAQPPGKKLQHISLLSGGERALTAIALMFSMIRINPSPVCLLDEIDAPLDEANVIRFSSYLRNLEDRSQFIVITHRKPTMSMCDILYGVAMEEKGVSKLVSVSLKEGA